jgi:hypothetical protein
LDSAVAAHLAFDTRVEEQIDGVGFFNTANGSVSFNEALVRADVGGAMGAKMINFRKPFAKGLVKFFKASDLSTF